MLIACGLALVALGCWATFTTSRTLRSRDWQEKRRSLALIGAVFVASCFLPGIAMLTGRFRLWMLVPLGVCYVALIPFPCYFRWANAGWIRTGRNVLFLLVGAGLIAVGSGLLPFSW